MPTLAHAITRVMARATATSAADVWADIAGASIASGSFVAGRKYLLLAKVLVDAADNGKDSGVSLWHGATMFAESYWADEPETATTGKQQYSFFTVWTAVASEAIKLRYLPRDGVAVYGYQHVKMVALDLSELVEGTDWHYNDVAASTTLATTDSTANNASVSFTPPAATDWLVLSSARMLEVSLAIRYRSKIVSTGTFASALPSAEREGEDAIGFGKVLWTMGRVYKALAASVQTFTEKSSTSGTPTTETRTNSKVFALNLNRFNQASAYTEAVVDLSATAFATQAQSVALAPPAPGDVLVFSFFALNNGAIGVGGKERLQVDGADITAGETTDSLNQNEAHNASDIWSFLNFDVYASDGSSHTYDLDASVEAAAAGRGANYRSLAAFTLTLRGFDGSAYLTPRASGSALLTLGAIGKAQPLPLRAAGSAGNPIPAAGSARLEPRASGAVPLVLLAAGKVSLDPRATGAAGVPISAALKVWLEARGFGSSFLGPLVFGILPTRTRRRVVRLEVWTGFEYAGGFCVGVLRSWHRGTLRHRRALNAESVWTVTVPGVPAFVATDRVLRVVYSDGSQLERLITDVSQAIALSGELSTALTAVHPIVELGLRGQVRSVDAAGRAKTRFERSSLTGKELLAQFIVGTMHELGLTYWQAGTVERDRLVRLTFDGSNPLDRLIALRDELGLEIVVRDDGVGSFYIDLVAATAAERPTVPARWARNTGPATVSRRLMDQATKIYVRGMREVNDEPAQMGAARWRVRAAVASATYDVWLQDAGELGFGPLRVPGQLVGMLLTFRDRYHVERRIPIIADDVAAQSVRLDPALAAPVFAQLAADDLVGFLAADGTELTAVEVPGADPLIMTLDRPEVPSTNNPVRNPALRHWILDAAGGAQRPVGWRVTSEAGATLARNVLPSFWETGGASALLNTRAEHQGMRGDVTELERGTADFPFLSAFARFWPTVGQLYLLLELFDEYGDAYSWPIGLDDDWVAANEERGAWQTVKLEVNLEEAAAWWNERHPLAPIVQDFWAARVSLLQKGPILAEAYVDRLQLTESRTVLEFAEGSGPAQLWHAGNEALGDYMGDAESVTVDFKDLSTLGGGQIPPSAVDPGVRMAVRIPPLALTRSTRVLAMEMDEDDPLNSSVTLAGRTDELTERLNRTQRFARTKLNA